MTSRNRPARYWLVAIALTMGACSSDLRSNGLAENKATIHEADGTISFYRGKNVANRLATGQDLGSGDEAYMRLRVSQSILDSAGSRPKGALTMSLEAERPGEVVEITLYTNALKRDPTEFETIVMNAADPYVTGYAQVVNQSPDAQGGYFEVKRWVRSAIGSYAEQMWSTGIFADSDAPSLKYNGPPASWPPVPDSWR